MQPDRDARSVRGERFAAAVGIAAHRLGIDATGARVLRLHDSAAFLLPDAGMVARMVEATDENRSRAALAIRITGWLRALGFAAVEPVHPVPFEAGGVVMTFWKYLPQPPDQAPPPVLAGALGRLLRDLHALPAPFRLPALDPFARLRAALALDAGRPQPVLTGAERAFLVARIAELGAAYAGLDFPCGRGLIHNDAHIGNLLASAQSPYGYVLADWESTRYGPREVDLVPEGAPGNHFGESARLRAAFAEGYGCDVAAWHGWRVLRDARDLHSLAAYIRVAPNDRAAAGELGRRLASLRTGDRSAIWRVTAG